MKPQICICCGEQMAEHAHGLSRNPNICASCSSMLDGMGMELDAETSKPSPESPPARAPTAPQILPDEEVVVDWAAGHFSKTSSRNPK